MANIKKLWILRHAKSDWDTFELTDFARPINERGELDARAMGIWSYEQKICPDIVLSSPAKRAKMTAATYLNQLEFDMSNLHYDENIYEARASDLLSILQQLPDHADNAMLIGHNPGVEAIAKFLVNDAYSLPSQGNGFMKTTALLEIHIDCSWSNLSDVNSSFVQCMKPKNLNQDYFEADE